ncbi:unnamed protein product [marine sediment metagenome]|uniref:Uncharacterized protein n=1 Tax=marine sediment metagenome TaxID=412755 RepID=X1QTL1_9ZZZZ
MENQMEQPAPGRPMDTYTVSTPFGTVIISNGGRNVAFELYSDIRQSRHNQALFTYIQHLQKQGVTQFNNDHIATAVAYFPLPAGNWAMAPFIKRFG